MKKYKIVIEGMFTLCYANTDKPLLVKSKREAEDIMWANLPTLNYDVIECK